MGLIENNDGISGNFTRNKLSNFRVQQVMIAIDHNIGMCNLYVEKYEADRSHMYNRARDIIIKRRTRTQRATV